MFIDFEGIINVRELGGLKSADGRKVRSHLLFRSGELENATGEDIRRLCEELKIARIIDFRDPNETRERPDREVPAADYLNFPALPPMEQPKDRIKDGPPPDAETMFPRVYRDLAESREAVLAYRNFFQTLLASGGKPVLWHCRQGKDRTGIAAILLLTALGISREECIREYLLTNDHMLPRYNRYLEGNPEPWKREMMKLITFVREDWLAEYLQIVDQRHGGLPNYLHDILLLAEKDIETLRSYYLE